MLPTDSASGTSARETGIPHTRRQFGGRNRQRERTHLQPCVYARRAGKVTGTADKVHLVPFGEYLPMPYLFQYLEGLTAESGQFAHGQSHRMITLPEARHFGRTLHMLRIDLSRDNARTNSVGLEYIGQHDQRRLVWTDGSAVSALRHVSSYARLRQAARLSERPTPVYRG